MNKFAKLAEQSLATLAEQSLATLAEHYIMSGWKVISGQKVMSCQKVIYNKWGKNEVFDELVIYYC